ncbi:MAG: hypothetical protein JSR55_00145 [Proteobacteria bacterium]|nr:hypothetical protein [Pseudomonadota bacterium]
MKKHILLAATGLLAALAVTPAFAAPGCLQVGQIYNFKALNDKTLIVEDNFHNKFRVALLGICPGLTFKEGIGFKTFGPHTSLTCVSSGDSIITRNIGTGRQRCAIQKVEPYTAEMMKADADAEAAKKAEH